WIASSPCGLLAMTASPAAAGGLRRRRRGGLRFTAGFRVRNARLLLADAVAVDRALAGGEESLPRDAGGIVDPGLLALGVAAGHLALLDDGAAGLMQPIVDVVQLVLVLDLDAQMIEAGRFAARRDGEIDARVVEHPLGVIRLHHRRLGGEQG